MTRIEGSTYASSDCSDTSLRRDFHPQQMRDSDEASSRSDVVSNAVYNCRCCGLDCGQSKVES